jgi:hypothetical protein
MKKAQPPQIAELDLPDTEDFTGNSARKFTGTDNRRHLRVIRALMLRPRRREEIDRIAGASNGPELIAELRRRGLRAPCKQAPGIDRDGRIIKSGIYEFDGDDKHAVNVWILLRDAKGKA